MVHLSGIPLWLQGRRCTYASCRKLAADPDSKYDNDKEQCLFVEIGKPPSCPKASLATGALPCAVHLHAAWLELSNLILRVVQTESY